MYSLVLSIGFKLCFLQLTNKESQKEPAEKLHKTALQKGSRATWPSLNFGPTSMDLVHHVSKGWMLTWAVAESIPEGGVGASVEAIFFSLENPVQTVSWVYNATH